MSNAQKVTQALVVTGPINPTQDVERIALFNSDGTPVTFDGTETGAQVLMTGYTAQSAGNVAATDTVNHAVAKLEARIAALEAA
jgi:hypothetical protein